MSWRELALEIPSNVRREILLTKEDIIHQAKAIKSDPNMEILIKIWREFIDQEAEEIECSMCIAEILKTFRSLKPELLKMEKEELKLDYL